MNKYINLRNTSKSLSTAGYNAASKYAMIILDEKSYNIKKMKLYSSNYAQIYYQFISFDTTPNTDSIPVFENEIYTTESGKWFSVNRTLDKLHTICAWTDISIGGLCFSNAENNNIREINIYVYTLNGNNNYKVIKTKSTFITDLQIEVDANIADATPIEIYDGDAKTLFSQNTIVNGVESTIDGFTSLFELLDSHRKTITYNISNFNNVNITDLPSDCSVNAAYQLINLKYHGNTDYDSYTQILINVLQGYIYKRFVRSSEHLWTNGYKGRWFTYIPEELRDNTQSTISIAKNDIYYALGDSITAGSYSTEDGKGVAVTNAEWSYPRRIGNIYGCTVHNLGVPGAAITEMMSQATQVGEDATLITITGGANDYYGRTIPLGTPEDTVGSDTVCGKLKEVIEYLLNKCYLCRIVLISPWLIGTGDISSQWSRNNKNANKGNFTYNELNEAFKNIADTYNIRFIDGLTQGPVNIYNVKQVQKDSIHPTKDFYAIIASWLGGLLF